MNPRVRHGLIGLGLAALTIVALGGACGHDFVYLDDGPYVFSNPKVQQGLSVDNVEWALTTIHMGYWMPATWFSLQLDGSLFWPGEDLPEAEAATRAAWGFHLTNLLFHVANVWLFYALLVRMTGAVGRSAFVAALFAVHPLHVESVVWITERKDVLSTFFMLLALLVYVRYTRTRRWTDYIVMVVFYFIGLASKPMIVTLPCVLLLLDYWPLGRLRWGQALPAPSSPGAPGGEGKRATLLWLVFEKLPLFLLSLVFGLVTMHTQYVVGAVSTALPLGTRIITALQGYGWYLLKTFWPTNLGLVYPLRYLPFGVPQVWVPLVVMLAITAFALWRWRSQPVLIVGWLWFAGTLFPVSGMFQSGDQGMADRFVYVPHLGLLLLIVWGAADLADRLRIPRGVQAALGLLVVAGMTYLAHEQTKHWHDTQTIMERSISGVPDNHRAHEILGGFMMDRRQNPSAALALAQKAIELDNKVASYHLLEAQAHAKLGHLQEKMNALERAVFVMEKQRTRQHMDPDAIFRLGEALYMVGDLDQGKKYLEEALRGAPNHMNANYTLGLLHLGQGNTQLALDLFERASKINPKSSGAWDRQGMALGRLGQWEKAVACCRKAIELEPKETYFRADLAYVYMHLGRKDEARAEYDRVLNLDPLWPHKASQRAVRLATESRVGLRDFGEALEMAEQACQADGFRDADLLRNREIVQTAYQEQRGK